MRANRKLRRIVIGLFLYVAVCWLGGVFLPDVALHPARRALTDDEVAQIDRGAQELHADLEDVSVTARDGISLRGWLLRPHTGNGNAALLLHGVADNRVGMSGYAELLARHGFTVLLPDARAHGASGGNLATYGLLERGDIQGWFRFLEASEHPHCIFGFGESMGASELLQSLDQRIPFCAVAVESPFANFREIAYDRMGQPFHLGPWFGRILLRPMVEVAFLRARWKYGFNMEQISPEDSVAATDVPVLLIHGQVDRNIPVRHARRIRTRNAKVQLWEVPGADHCGAISTAPQEFERRLFGWFDDHTPKKIFSHTDEAAPGAVDCGMATERLKIR